MKYLILFLVLVGGYASAHQFTPTYPELVTSHITGVKKAEMVLYNTRKDIKYYAIGVFDSEWNKVRFASESKLISLDHLERKYVTVYISDKDLKKVKYICSKSKILLTAKEPSIVSSRICSKIK